MDNSQKIRIERYESRMMECINNFISFEVYDKKIKHAKIVYAKLSNDMSVIKFYVDSLNRDHIDKLVENLNKRKGVFRSKLAKEFDLRKTPSVIFKKDETIDRYNTIESIFDELNINKKKE